MKTSAEGTVTNLSSSSLRSLSLSTRYRGLIEESTYKKIRNSLFVLFDYVAQTAPPFFAMHTIVSVWRVIQFLGASLVVNNKHFWGPGTIMDKVSDIIAVFFHFLPSSVRKVGAFYVLLVFIIVFFLILVLIGGSAYYFATRQKLPKGATIAISVVCATVGYIFPPAAVNYMGEIMARIIVDSSQADPANIAVLVISILILLAYIWVFYSIYSVSIIFRPDSLMTVIPSIQTMILVSCLLITFLLGVASELDQLSTIILSLVSAVLYLASNFIYYSKGGLVNQTHLKALTATSTAGGILLIIVGVFMFMEQYATEIVLVVYIGVWLVCYVFFSFFINWRIGKTVTFLDSLEEDQENYELIKSSRKLSDMIVTGFRSAHPACLSWSVFKYGITKWPSSVDTWLLYSKFIAIYPEETQQLAFISIGMSQNHLKGTLAKHTMSQIISIMKQRESNLSPELKAKLDKIGKQVQQTKHKIRYIWDLVLQGNIKELEYVIQRAYKAIDSCEAEFYHLLRQYPNNRFVARTYARFLRDVVADHAAHKKWAQNVSLLQREISVVPDQAHDLGLRAFQLLPKTIESSLNQTNNQTTILTDDTLTQDIDADDEQATIDAELRVSVRESINTLVIPSFKEAKILIVVSWLVFFFAPALGLSIFAPFYITMISEPLDYIYYIAVLRNYIFQSITFGHHYVCENLHVTYSGINYYPLAKPDSIESQIEPPPESFGDTFDTRLQTEDILSNYSLIIPVLSPLMSFKPNNPQIDQIRSIFFEPSVDFLYISDPEFLPGYSVNDVDYTNVRFETSIKRISVQAAVAQLLVFCHDIIDNNVVTPTDLMQQKLAIPLNNIEKVTDLLSSMLEIFREYVKALDDTNTVYMNIGTSLSCVIIPVLLVIFSTVIQLHVTRDKMTIYKCLTSLPKNVVSHVADTFKVLKKDEDDEMKTRSKDEDLNRQEENMLKIFAASSDSGTGSSSDLLVLVVITILLIGCFVSYAASMLQFYSESSTQLSRCAPHIDFLTGSYSYDLASILLFDMLPGTAAPSCQYNIYNFDKDAILKVIYTWQARSSQVYSAMRYGDDRLGAVPFNSLGISMDEGMNSKCATSAAPVTKHDIYKCWTADILLAYSQMQIKNMVHSYQENDHMISGDDYHLTHVWHIHQYHLFDQYFQPRFDTIISLLLKAMNQKVPMMIAICIVLMIVALLLESILLFILNSSEARQKFALRLLLHCPGNVVISNQSITTILTGNFKVHHIDSTTRGAEFFEGLVSHLPDCVIIMTPDGHIKSANTSTQRIFETSEEELVDKHINVLGSRFKEGNPFTVLSEGSSSIENFTRKYSADKADGSIIHFEVTFRVLPENLLVMVSDITQNVMYNQLISDESAKSDQLLSSILPAKLVPRVQAGEKNISFAVQSATILFMDICSFTPWCGSLPASKVMATLNRLFKEYDSLVAMRPTITKIKCIGDCYMCAGGIFSEVNQPAVHAKDVVEFGLDSIQALIKVDKEIGQELQMRVGINTGGPIVAGVLGTEKPTFEILGPPINMAQQMEHHGVPMKVHVSRAVYELIYGGNFIVKERGEIEIKNGTIVTYLIDRKT